MFDRFPICFEPYHVSTISGFVELPQLSEVIRSNYSYWAAECEKESEKSKTTTTTLMTLTTTTLTTTTLTLPTAAAP